MTQEAPDARAALIDPVCGKAVDPTEMYRPHVYGGAMFCFCSEACRTRFIAEPERFVSIRTAPGIGPSAPQAAAALAAAPVAGPAVAATIAPPSPMPPSQSSTTTRDRDHHAPDLPQRGIRNLIASQVIAWREGRYAARTARELLALHEKITASHPGLQGRAVLRQVVMERTDCNAAEAELMLDNAEESFALWPARRELTFCDVVHYLSVVGFLAEHKGEHWMHADIAHIVASRLPHHLCVTRKSS